MSQLRPMINKKVYVHRDYSDGLTIKFQTKMPEELHGRITEQTFENTINRINQIYSEAERVTAATYCSNILSCIVGYLIYYLVTTPYDKAIKNAAKYLEQENSEIYGPKRIMLRDPIISGLRTMEIVIYNED